MNKLALTLVLALSAFSLGVIADETIRPDGWSWQKISRLRQLGYVEGFVDGQMESSEETRCKTLPTPAKNPTYWQSLGPCILSRLRDGTYLGTDANKTLDIMDKFYQSPQNIPVRWGHAVTISQAMMSGVPVSDKDLEEIRKEDGTPPQPMTPLEEQKLRDFIRNSPSKK